MNRIPRPILALVLLALTAAAPTTQPGVGVVIPAGAGRETIQRKISDAWARGLPVTLDAGTYRVDSPLVIPAGQRVTGNGAVRLVGTVPGPILILTESNVVEGLQFTAATPGVTGIAGAFVRTRVRDCDFTTALAFGIDAHGLLSRITDCRFGLAGDVPKAFQAIRVRSADGSSNAWEIDHCAFYNAAGDVAVEVGDGYQLDFSFNNVERNRTRAALRVAGMSMVHSHDNWWENNVGESQVELVHDRSDSIGNYVSHFHDEYVNLSGPGNVRFLLTYGACGVNLHDINGTNWNGKAIASDMGKVKVGSHWLVGWNKPAGDGP